MPPTPYRSAIALALCLGMTACAHAPAQPAPASPSVAKSDTAMSGMDMSSQEHMDMSGTTPGGMGGMSGGGMGGMMMDLPATAGPGYTVADVQFMQGMIGHHSQAVVMAEWAPTHGASASVQKLAQKIDISQRDEIVFMKRWLAERQQAVPTDSQAAAMMMPGMLTKTQLAQLNNARGTEYDRLFLTLMIGHHRGALQMVDDLVHSPEAAQEPEIFRFVTDVDTDQRAEIDVMTDLLSTLR